MPDYEGMLDAIYDGLGIPAQIDGVDVTVKNATSDAVLDFGNGIQFGTIKPLYLVRGSELAANDIERDALKGATFSVNGSDWTIISTHPKPKPSGLGEFYLVVQPA